VDYPDVNGATIYDANPKGDGEFDDNEREEYLTRAKKAILHRLSMDEQEPITLDRFDDYHQRVGEDFCDQGGATDYAAILGYCMAKRPDIREALAEETRDGFEALTILQVYEDNFEDGNDLFYGDLAECANQMPQMRKYINEALFVPYDGN
jgi:hypothetical protein